jgi:hypothetical protein
VAWTRLIRCAEANPTDLLGAGLALPYYLGILGAGYIQAEQFDAARQVLEQGVELAEKNDDGFTRPNCIVFKASCYWRSPETNPLQRRAALSVHLKQVGLSKVGPGNCVQQ